MLPNSGLLTFNKASHNPTTITVPIPITTVHLPNLRATVTKAATRDFVNFVINKVILLSDVHVLSHSSLIIQLRIAPPLLTIHHKIG